MRKDKTCCGTLKIKKGQTSKIWNPWSKYLNFLMWEITAAAIIGEYYSVNQKYPQFLNSDEMQACLWKDVILGIERRRIKTATRHNDCSRSWNSVILFVLMFMTCRGNLTLVCQLACGKFGFFMQRFASSCRTYRWHWMWIYCPSTTYPAWDDAIFSLPSPPPSTPSPTLTLHGGPWKMQIWRDIDSSMAKEMPLFLCYIFILLSQSYLPAPFIYQIMTKQKCLLHPASSKNIMVQMEKALGTRGPTL